MRLSDESSVLNFAEIGFCFIEIKQKLYLKLTANCILLLCCLQAAFRDGSGPQGQVWTTESVISGWLFGIIFAVELAEPYSLQTSETGWDGQVCCSVAFNFH